MEGIIVVILFIALVGFLVWLITENIPMPPAFKATIIVVTIIALVLWIMSALFGSGGLPTFPRIG